MSEEGSEFRQKFLVYIFLLCFQQHIFNGLDLFEIPFYQLFFEMQFNKYFQ